MKKLVVIILLNISCVYHNTAVAINLWPCPWIKKGLASLGIIKHKKDLAAFQRKYGKLKNKHKLTVKKLCPCPTAKIDAGFCQSQSPLPGSTMQDRVTCEKKGGFQYFSVLDGHGGDAVVDYAAKNLDTLFFSLLRSTFKPKLALTESYQEMDAQLRALPDNVSLSQGTSAITLLIADNNVTLGHVGNARAVLCTDEGVAIPLSEDHTPDRQDEFERITNAGGSVSYNANDPTPRVNRRAAISRALGNHGMDEGAERLIIPEPETTTHTISERDEFLLLASNGVWKHMSNQDAITIVRDALATGCEPKKAAKCLVKKIIAEGCSDDITALVICLNKSTS